jgi:hypothetical protein
MKKITVLTMVSGLLIINSALANTYHFRCPSPNEISFSFTSPVLKLTAPIIPISHSAKPLGLNQWENHYPSHSGDVRGNTLLIAEFKNELVYCKYNVQILVFNPPGQFPPGKIEDFIMELKLVPENVAQNYRYSGDKDDITAVTWPTKSK